LEFFADDLYCDTRAASAALSADEWNGGASKPPALESMNSAGRPLLSERDEGHAHMAMKRAQARTDTFRRQREEEEARLKKQTDTFGRFQQLATQHEAYNPNLSKGLAGHDEAFGKAQVEEESEDVADDEW
jgi:hypothetical protein